MEEYNYNKVLVETAIHNYINEDSSCKIRELFWERDTAGYPVKKINSYFTTDLKGSLDEA